ncbi:MAG: type II secretion system protein, partial [bacterium]
MLNQIRNQDGFTLLQIIISMLILSTLLAVVAVKLAGDVLRARGDGGHLRGNRTQVGHDRVEALGRDAQRHVCALLLVATEEPGVGDEAA